jgi:hypothetical protein
MTANLGIAVIWELNQAVLSLIPDSRAISLKENFVPFAVVHQHRFELVLWAVRRHRDILYPSSLNDAQKLTHST